MAQRHERVGVAEFALSVSISFDRYPSHKRDQGQALEAALTREVPHCVQAPRSGPGMALKSLQQQSFSVAQCGAWMEAARLEAVLGSCRRSLPSVRSGLQCYVAFVKTMMGTGERAAPFPPRIEWLQAWSRLFRSARTFSNYIGYVHTGCLVVKAPTDVFGHPALKRAKIAVEKAGGFVQREKLWIRRPRVEAMLRWAKDHQEFWRLAVLFLTAYVFLLRVPSEALPMVVSDGSSSCTGQSVIFATDQEVVLTLRRRKNKPSGSRLIRRCWCSECQHTCPVHVLGPLLQGQECGQRFFEGITAASALTGLRHMLVAIGVGQAQAYRTHDLRRGHALDLQCSGAPLWEILQAGEWTSPAFMKYLDLHRLDTELVVQAHAAESDSESSDSSSS